ncbi:MAG TPA: RluA family pseudouridine synthase [Phycisphaerae bacterium]|nr:RluA family pseudouridine synthase [Phycisphaerae bacterium]HNU45520.1 RluA family pseudouridine synthase [Phycisphaerae bacterium]
MARSTACLPPVLYEDETLTAFDKPSGLRVVPDRWDADAVCLMDLVHRCGSPEWFNVHRLDRDTSGVLLCAKTKDTLTALTDLFEMHRVEKRYVALTRGCPENSPIAITAALAADPQRPGRMCATPEGKPSETVVEVVESWACGHALLRAFPKTGRTHQVRVHLAHLGCPVVGDALYGDGRPLFLSDFKRGYKRRSDDPEPPLLSRLALHAQSLTLDHPVTHGPLTIESRLPDDLQFALKQLRRHGR